MPFSKRSGGPEELTSPENANRNATLTSRAIARISVWANRATFYDPNAKPEELGHPAPGLAAEFTERSASRDGEFRKDLVESMKSGGPAVLGLAVPDGKSASSKEEKRGF